MSTHNIDFYEDLTKVIFELSSNTHLIFSAEFLLKNVYFERNEIQFKPVIWLTELCLFHRIFIKLAEVLFNKFSVHTNITKANVYTRIVIVDSSMIL